MSDILVRDFDPLVAAALRRIAARNDRSLASEIRSILTDAARQSDTGNVTDRLRQSRARQQAKSLDVVAAFRRVWRGDAS